MKNIMMFFQEPLLHTDSALSVCVGLRDLYLTEELCDTTVVTESRRFLCHRVVLASVSPYFRAMFSSSMREAERGEVVLPDIPPSIMQTVLNFIYTGEATINMDTVQELFTVSSRLQISPLQHLCSSYLIKEQNQENCLWIYKMAYSHNDKILCQAALQYISCHFTSLYSNNSFQCLDLGEITSVLSSDSLMVSSELCVYRLACRWWEFNNVTHCAFPEELLRVIRFYLMSPRELEEVREDKLVEIPSSQNSEGLALRQGMFDDQIVSMDLLAREDRSLEDADYHLDAYDPALEVWEKLPALKSLMCPGILALGSRLYVAGGMHKDDSISNTLHLYDSVRNNWTKLSSMFSSRYMHGFVSYGQRLYALGGCDENDVIDSVEHYNLLENHWSCGSRMPFPLCSFACAQLKGRLYLIGGESSVVNLTSPLRGVLVYNPSSDMWCQFSLPMVCSSAGAVVLDNKLYVIGGRVNYDHSAQSCRATSKCFCLDDQGRVCRDSYVPSLPKNIASAGVVCWKRRIYVLGGEDRNKFYKQVYYWTPGDIKWTLCRTTLPIVDNGVSGFGCVTMQIPKKRFYSLIPGRRVSSRVSHSSST
ncbi:hypothetical protein XENTR_v10009920 [Xenopus tropicalis]|nr:hypothetical protein XENTR_v10009920 [Xenopus tropicalis]